MSAYSLLTEFSNFASTSSWSSTTRIALTSMAGFSRPSTTKLLMIRHNRSSNFTIVSFTCKVRILWAKQKFSTLVSTSGGSGSRLKRLSGQWQTLIIGNKGLSVCKLLTDWVLGRKVIVKPEFCCVWPVNPHIKTLTSFWWLTLSK